MTEDKEDKQEVIINELKRRAEDVRFGVITAEFKIHQGKIQAGEVVSERRKLG